MNHIKRTAFRIIYQQLIDTTAGKAGDIMTAWKDENGWHTRNASRENDATYYYCFLDFLRNENITRFITQMYTEGGKVIFKDYEEAIK